MTAPEPVQDAAAGLLRTAADALAASTIRWGRGELIDACGARCAAGAVAWAADPDHHTGNPHFISFNRPAAERAIDALADYLVDEHAAPEAIGEPLETVGNWNDGRADVADIVAALRAAADRMQHISGAA